MKHHITAIGGALLLTFTAIGVTNLRNTEHKIRLQQIQLEDRGAELKKLQIHYQYLNQDLDTELKNKDQNQDRIKQLEQEKNQLEIDKQKLERDLQAKRNAANAIAQAPPKPIQAVSAASSPSAAKMFIYMRESGNRTNAVNPSSGACGLGQALPCSKMGCTLSDYACQDNFFTGYMLARYGSWENAKNFWLAHSWW